MSLEISLKNKTEFLNLFGLPVIDAHSLTLKSKANLYVLKINAGTFDYESMINELGNASTHYVLSRGRIQDLSQEEGKNWQLMSEVVSKFKDWGKNDGEGGELLLYCFLETHLNAPKLLSKMELKTANNDYIKGSDGIHLLKIADNDYQIIYGESKMYANLTDGIREAISSLKSLKDKGFNTEASLVDSNIMKESLNQEELAYIKSVLIPAKDPLNMIQRNNAFGVFLSFEIDISQWDLQNMKDEDIDNQIRSTVKSTFEAQFENIKNQIIKSGLDGHHFYFYSIPFLKKDNANISLDQTRKDIIKKITFNDSN